MYVDKVEVDVARMIFFFCLLRQSYGSSLMHSSEQNCPFPWIYGLAHEYMDAWASPGVHGLVLRHGLCFVVSVVEVVVSVVEVFVSVMRP